MDANGNLDSTEMLQMPINTITVITLGPPDKQWLVTRVFTGWIYTGHDGHSVFVPEGIPYQIQ